MPYDSHESYDEIARRVERERKRKRAERNKLELKAFCAGLAIGFLMLGGSSLVLLDRDTFSYSFIGMGSVMGIIALFIRTTT